ncbi:MAG: hypothetical protein LQ348_003807 [Seirophora lacunosa]|nr:MAG: hypothetical protein LQ348_003807 [Seirophora lacunosa]
MFRADCNLATTIDTIDLSQRWNIGNNKIWNRIEKITSVSKPGPPSLNDGAIFANATSLWLYGGVVTAAQLKQRPPTPPNGIWRYDIAAGEWTQPYASGDPVSRQYLGMSTNFGNSKAVYLGGAGSGPGYLTQGLLVFDGYQQSFSNVSTTGLNRYGTVAMGFLSLIESVGDQGILVAFGGLTNVAGKVTRLLPDMIEEDDPTLQWPMRNISVYDIAHDRWYQQQSTGDIPPWRYHGCSLVVGAADQSSYSIYTFGGWNSKYSDKNNGDIYVLSLSSFAWIQVSQDADPRVRHRCHLMGHHHMLVVGGVKPAVDDPVPYDSVGCDNNPRFSQGLGIFSLNDHKWRTDYDPIVGSAPYQVHSSISNVIGGNATGGATKTIPDHGFSSNMLRDLFGVPAQSSSPSTSTDSASISEPTSGSRASHVLKPGAIAGISIGSASLLAITLGVLWVLRNRLRRHRQHYPRKSLPDGQTLPPLSHPSGPTELHAGPAAQEMCGGHAEDSLARMYQSPKESNTTERYEMPHTLESHATASRFDIHELSASLAIAELPEQRQR